MVMFLLPNSITHLCSAQGLYEEETRGNNIELPENRHVCYTLAPRCDSSWYISLYRQRLCGFPPPPPPPPWVLLGASCRQNWSEGQKDFSWLVRWGRFWVQPQGCNTLREKRMGLGLLGAGTQPADGARRLPWIWASQQAKADRAPEPLLLAAGFCHAPEPSPGTQQHETSSKCTTL